MKTTLNNFAPLCLCASSFLIFASFAARAEEDDEKKGPKVEPSAKIETALLTREKIAETITAYGTIQTLPAATKTLAAPFECRVKRVLANEGQAVEKGATLVELEPSPDSKLLLQSSINALASANLVLSNVTSRLAMRLATTADLLAAQQAVQDAELKLANLRERGIEGDPSLHAAEAGTISKVDVQAGALVAAGAAVAEITTDSSRVARIGIEPSDLEKVSVGKTASLKSVMRGESKPVEGKFSMIARAVDPETRLVIATALLPDDDGLLLGESITASIKVSEKEALVVPREAALPEEDHFVIFTVKDGKAAKHEVKLGIQTSEKVEIAEGDLKEGDTVVIEGNYELTDGMKIASDEDEKKDDKKSDEKSGAKDEKKNEKKPENKLEPSK